MCLWHYIYYNRNHFVCYFDENFYQTYSYFFFLLFAFLSSFAAAYSLSLLFALFLRKLAFILRTQSNVIHMQILVCHTSHKWFCSVNVRKVFFFLLSFRMEVLNSRRKIDWVVNYKTWFLFLSVWHMFSCKLCCCVGNVKCQKETSKIKRQKWCRKKKMKNCGEEKKINVKVFEWSIQMFWLNILHTFQFPNVSAKQCAHTQHALTNYKAYIHVFMLIEFMGIQ